MAEFVTLNTGAMMPAIGFGTWQLKQGQTKAAVLQALDIGYRLIDTAKIYGNEMGVGEAVHATTVPREDIFVTTKLWNSDQGFEYAQEAFEASLDRLGLDFVDLYLIHWPGGADRIGSWRALEKIYESGRAKAVGVSNYTTAHLQELFDNSSVVPAVNQIEFHPFIYRQQKPVLDLCAARGIALEAYSPLAHGGRQMHNSVITEIAKSCNRSNAQVMLRWAIQHGTVPIPKSSHPNRMRENLSVFDFALSKEDMKALDNLEGKRTTWDPTNIR